MESNELRTNFRLGGTYRELYRVLGRLITGYTKISPGLKWQRKLRVLNLSNGHWGYIAVYRVRVYGIVVLSWFLVSVYKVH